MIYIDMLIINILKNTSHPVGGSKETQRRVALKP